MVSLLDSVLAHVESTPDIRVAALFGSQARARKNAGHAADAWSDVDIQVVTTRAGRYADPLWAASMPGHSLQVYARRSVFGGVFKFTALYGSGELDLVVVPYRRLNLGRLAFQCGLHRRIKAVQSKLSNFADLMRFEHLVVKGGEHWESFYRKASREVPRFALSDQEALEIAGVAYVDAVWILGRIARGELIAAQRILHHSVIETNIRLLHEWRERQNLPAHHRARRAESVLPPDQLAAVQYSAPLEAAALRAAVNIAVAQMRKLVEQLTGTAPDWPALPPSS